MGVEGLGETGMLVSSFSSNHTDSDCHQEGQHQVWFSWVASLCRMRPGKVFLKLLDFLLWKFTLSWIPLMTAIVITIVIIK